MAGLGVAGTRRFVSRATGRLGYRQLTDDTFSDRAPRWAPDGKRIAFYSDRSGKYEIWTIRPDGSGLQQLTETKEPLTYVVWSPDGGRVASGAPAGIGIFDAIKGKVPQPLETLPSVEKKLEMLPWCWSADGKLLAASPRTGGESAGIFTYSFDTKRWERATEFGYGALWFNDSRNFVFSNNSAVYVSDRVSKIVKQIKSVEPHQLGWELGLWRDNRRIFFNLDILESDIWLMTLPRTTVR
jgi:dipeptidyl aminopeptidase/acylaminoacyl peptidase